MAKLEDITIGSNVTGIAGCGTVTIQATKWHGSGVLEVTYKDAHGHPGNQLLMRDEEDAIGIAAEGLPWSFTADANAVRLASEAYRIHLAHLFDPYLAVHISDIEPLPHQISAVYQEMLDRQPLRYVLADDPGAGKTIMTGLFIKELIARGDLRRCLIVTPGSLSEQWKDELSQKFHLQFKILTNDRINSAATGNVFAEAGLCIARLDRLSRSEELQEKLKVTDWDLIVCDEAHKMSATVWSGEVKTTKRFELGRLLSGLTRHYLLLTATPHNGKDQDFQLFMSLIDEDRFGGVARTGAQTNDFTDVMRRLVKEDLLTFEGKPLFPERRATTVSYDLSPEEAALYTAVTQYVQEEFNRADKLDGKKKTTVGFALTVLQRRLASSPEAIYQSLCRRRERMENRLDEERDGRGAENPSSHITDDEYDEDDLSSLEAEKEDDSLAASASAATTIAELEAEIATLRRLEGMAHDVRTSGRDRKWEELSTLLQDEKAMFGADGQRQKLIIFTEHRDTLRYLTQRIRTLLGDDEAVVNIDGSMVRENRHKTEAIFKQDKRVLVLVATDAAGEGINLQRAHLMVNYDLPWNPNRLEQRFGRIHRIGQTEVCHLWNLVAGETREGQVFQRLFGKLEQEREALGGKVFDILGKVTYENRLLRDLLIEAIRYGDDPTVRARLDQVVDHSLNHEVLKQILDDRALTEDVMDGGKVQAIREDMERMEAHRLQPHFVQEFFMAAFRGLGGKVSHRESGRYEITQVPESVRSRVMQIGYGVPELKTYERICFDKRHCEVPGKPQADLVCPGHPLLDAVIDIVLERHTDDMRQGTIFVDENDSGTEPRLLFSIEVSIQDGKPLPGGGRRVISRRVHFVEIGRDGGAADAGYAPYLDYRAPTPEEHDQVAAYVASQNWLCRDVEERANGYAIASCVPVHYGEVKDRRLRAVAKAEKAVKERLTAEIQYWDFRAGELKRQEDAGKPNAKINSQLATQRAEKLAARLRRRTEELEQERQVFPRAPVVTAGAVVIPLGLLREIMGVADENGDSDGSAPESQDSAARREVELAAMRAVMTIERELGYEPVDVSATKCGYDVESRVPEGMRDGGACLRFIEVKGRAVGADTVTITKNEILTALNKPDDSILAIVEVDGGRTSTRYLKRAFRSTPDFAATSVTYAIADLAAGAEVVLVRDSMDVAA
ncbi:MAG: DUF3883 domain-containing protein [Desulfovibrio sp.]|jgi:superfamily II DNA or RNA helicase|nr:DUF3883 domain-containing protein [Desulfovibrio sp.]